MSRVVLFLCLGIFSVSSLAAGAQSAEFAKSLSTAFKNHTIVKKNNYQELATIYGGDDISHKPLPLLRVIA